MIRIPHITKAAAAEAASNIHGPVSSLNVEIARRYHRAGPYGSYYKQEVSEVRFFDKYGNSVGRWFPGGGISHDGRQYGHALIEEVE